MPKKKGGKKGAKIIDGLPTNDMSREQLMGHIKRIQLELEREREERNFFMLEREKLFSLWTLAQEQVAVEKNKAFCMEIQRDEGEKENEERINVYKQKLRFLMSEQSKILGQIRLNHLKKMKRVQDDVWRIESSVSEALVEKRRELRKCQSAAHELLRESHTSRVKETVALRTEFSESLRQLEATFERKLFEFIENYEILQMVNLDQLRLNKRNQMAALEATNKAQMEKVKEYFGEISVNSFATIAALQEKLNEARGREDELKGKLKCANQRYQSLIRPFQALEGKLKLLEEKNHLGQVQSQELVRARREATEKNDRLRAFHISTEALIQKNIQSQSERETMRTEFYRVGLEMQKKSTMNEIIFEMRVRGRVKFERPINSKE